MEVRKAAYLVVFTVSGHLLGGIWGKAVASTIVQSIVFGTIYALPRVSIVVPFWV